MASKANLVRQVVASRLLPVAPGERIPTTADLAAAAQAGFGTVQGALRSLEADELIVTTTHGRQGTRLVTRDLAGLWSATGRGALTGVLPLPQSTEFAGLASALTVIAESAGLPLQLLFRQGNTVRAALLDSGRVDFTVMSSFAASQTPQFATRRLGLHTYYAHDAVVVITANGVEPDPRGLVPIDRRSVDHAALTLAEFPDARLVDAPYLSIPELVTSGAVDAAVWHRTSASPLLTASGLDIHALRLPSPAADGSLSVATIAWRDADADAALILGSIFSTEDVRQLQTEVMTGARIPQY